MVLGLSGCISNPNTLSMGAIGAAAGGYGGSQFGKGQGKVLATAGATALGGLLGAFVGNKLDTINANQQSIQQISTMKSFGAPPSVYIAPPSYHLAPQTPQQYQVPLNCSIQNNYVTCRSQ